MTIVVTMRTADRSCGARGLAEGRPNYLGTTIRNLSASGMDVANLHVFVGDADASWVHRETEAPVQWHIADRALTPNENALAQISVLDQVQADWILMLEDDLEFCADFLGSVRRWMSVHATDAHRVYRFFSFREPVAEQTDAYVFDSGRLVGSQAVLLRADDARRLLAWHSDRYETWRPHTDPLRHQTTRGWDKLIGYWSLDRAPWQRTNLVSKPFFVRHIGEHSSLALRSFGMTANHRFDGRPWGAEVAA